MQETIEQRVRRLLRAPIDTQESWSAEVKALDPSAAIPVLTAILGNSQERPLARKLALAMLELLPDARAVPALTQALSDADPVIRARATVALAKIEQPHGSTVEALIQRLDDADYFVRESAAKALGALKRPEALPALARMSADDAVASNQEVARRAAEDIRGEA